MSEDSNKQVLDNIEEEHFDTDDFSTSTSSELNTSASGSDGIKMSPGSSDNDTSNGKASSCAATETKTTIDDRKPPPKHDYQQKRSESKVDEENTPNQNKESFPHTLRRMLNAETEAGKAIKWLTAGDGFVGKLTVLFPHLCFISSE